MIIFENGTALPSRAEYIFPGVTSIVLSFSFLFPSLRVKVLSSCSTPLNTEAMRMRISPIEIFFIIILNLQSIFIYLIADFSLMSINK